MTVKYVTRLIPKSGATYQTVEEWIADNNAAGTTWPEVVKFTLELESNGSTVLRTLWYNSKADFESAKNRVKDHFQAAGMTKDDRLYDVEKIEGPVAGE